jgi:glycosyltransferase involved in cell wall biosynthesis
MPKVLHRHPHARAVFLGRGDADEASPLRRLSVDLGVDSAVEFHPWTTHPQPFYRDATLLVLPSRSEGFGRTLVEAALVGRAVVASRVGGIPEVVVDGETGLLVPADDPPALAEALLLLLGDPALRRRLAASARTRALASFTIRRHVEAVQDVYAELLASTPVRLA